MASNTLPKPTFCRGIVLNHKEREIILNVYKYFQNGKDTEKMTYSFSDVVARTSRATGINKNTVRRIGSKGNETDTLARTDSAVEKFTSGMNSILVLFDRQCTHVIRNISFQRCQRSRLN